METENVTCACCGQSRTPSDVVRLHRHPETAVCGPCVHRMSAQLRARPVVTPIFPVRNMEQAQRFWSRTGVEVELYDAGYAFVRFLGSEIAHLAVHTDLDPARNAAACYLHVDDARAWHERWRAAGLPVTDVAVRPWGMLEFQLRDPDGNLLRVGRGAE